MQSIALYYGVWVSQQVVRNMAGGEFLLADNDTKALAALHFDYEEWGGSSAPQFNGFMEWIGGNLKAKIPSILGAYVSDGTNDPDYDHEMPAVGLANATAPGFTSDSVLVFNDNFGDQLQRTFGSLTATRATCAYDSLHGGCIPDQTDYGVAVRGVTDVQNVTRAVSLSVNQSSEPNVSLGEKPVLLQGTVTAWDLVPGQRYTLLRYDDSTKVPTNGSVADFIASASNSRITFSADGPDWTYVDPTPILSSGTTYYRCVPTP